MLTFEMKKVKSLSMPVLVEGIDQGQLKFKFVIEADGVDYGFPAEQGGDNVKFIIPPLDTVVKTLNEGIYKAKLEVSALTEGDRGFFMQRWAEEIRVKQSVSVEVEPMAEEVHEEEVEKTDASELRQRAEDFALEVVPMGGLMLKAAIDIQKDRFELLVWAIGEGEEMWTVDYKIIEANPTIQSDFDKLDQYLLRSYQHISGTQLYIDEFALDTGNWTQQAYQYVRSRKKIQNWIGLNPNQHPPKAFGTKGVGTAGKPLSSKPTLQDISTYDRVIKQGLKLYSIGTETGKTLFYNRLQVTQAGPGFVHLSKYLPDEFFQHITNEVRVLKHTKKGKVYSWEMRRAGARNECLDCSVMVLFLNSRAGLHNKTKSYWANLRNIVQPNQVDLFAVDSAISHSLPVDIEKKLIKPIQPHSTHNKTGFKEVAAPW